MVKFHCLGCFQNSCFVYETKATLFMALLEVTVYSNGEVPLARVLSDIMFSDTIEVTLIIMSEVEVCNNGGVPLSRALTEVVFYGIAETRLL